MTGKAKTMLIHPGVAPFTVGIMQAGDTLFAASQCCYAVLHHNADDDWWYCSTCERHNGFIQPSHPSRMQSVIFITAYPEHIASWAGEWTGLGAANLKVTVEP